MNFMTFEGINLTGPLVKWQVRKQRSRWEVSVKLNLMKLTWNYQPDWTSWKAAIWKIKKEIDFRGIWFV